MNFKIPTIEEIYEEYHRETFFAMKSVYPRRLKNFNKIITVEKRELLKRFQDFVKRNFGSVDWKLYVKACAKYYKRSFDLKILGSLGANKIYRSYIAYSKMSDERSADDIYDDILNSVKFIKDFASENGISVKGYFQNRESVIPIVIKHIYAGTVSTYFYACLDTELNFKIFGDIPDDVFYELFNVSRNEFLSMFIAKKRDSILTKAKVFKVINTINEKFSKALE
jgi:hypothetical protein